MNLNQKIVKQYEDNCFSPYTKVEIIGHCFLYGSICMLIGLLSYGIFDSIKRNLFTMVFGSLSFVLISTLSILGHEDCRPIGLYKFIIHLMHYLLPNRAERDKEVKAYYETNLALKQLHKKRTFKNNPLFDITDIHAWLIENVSDLKTVLKICHKRAVYKDKSLNMDFIYWTQLIPYITNIDVYKQVLMSSKVAGNDCLNKMIHIARPDITKMFSLYKDEDLLMLFTSPLAVIDYLEVLEFGLTNQIEFPIESNMNDLYISVKELVRLKEGSSYLFKTGSLKDGEYEGYVLEQVKHIRHLSDVARYMQNCLLSKEEKCLANKTQIYVLKKDNKPFIVFEYKGKVVEAKKRFNESLTSDEKAVLDMVVSRGKV